MADSRAQLSEADRPAFLDELGMALYRLGDSARSTKLWRELLTLQPDNLEVLRRLASAAIGTGDSAAFEEIVTLVRKIEGEEGTLWRYLEAVELIRQSGTAEPGKPAPARKSQHPGERDLRQATELVVRISPSRSTRRAREQA